MGALPPTQSGVRLRINAACFLYCIAYVSTLRRSVSREETLRLSVVDDLGQTKWGAGGHAWTVRRYHITAKENYDGISFVGAHRRAGQRLVPGRDDVWLEDGAGRGDADGRPLPGQGGNFIDTANVYGRGNPRR